MNDFSDLLYIVAAIAIFGMLLVTASQSMIRNNVVTMGNEQEFTAVALANGIIEEARVLRFDHSNSCNVLNMTLPISLGPEAGENYTSLGLSNFNDFDDFHGLAVTEATDSGIFTIGARVYYVTQLDPATEMLVPTPHKRLDVTVTGNTLESDVTLSYITSCRP